MFLLFMIDIDLFGKSKHWRS